MVRCRVEHNKRSQNRTDKTLGEQNTETNARVPLQHWRCVERIGLL